MKKFLAILMIVVLALSALAGCSKTNGAAESAAVTTAAAETTAAADTTAAAASGKTYKIGFCSASYEVPFQVALMNACTDALKGYGCFDVDAQDGKNDPATQTTIIENFITQKKDMIILVAAQSDSLVPAVQECNAAKIPVVVVNRSLGEGADIVTEVNMDCVAAGKLEGELATDVLGDKGGNIAYLTGTLGSGPQVQESEGFAEYLKDHPELKVAFEQTTNWDKATAIQVVENMLTKFSAGQIDAIVCQGPDDAIGAAEACKSAGRTELLGKITAFDYPQYVKDAIQDGSVYGTINQSPKLQGKLAADVAYKYFTQSGATFDKLTAIDLNKVTADNCDQYEVAW